MAKSKRKVTPMETADLTQLARQLRTDAGLTQAELAARLGVTAQAISAAERNADDSRMNAMRCRIIEELSGRKVEGPVWFFADEVE